MHTRIFDFLRSTNTLFLLTGILTFLTLSYYGLQNVGYYYDELLHATAAQETLSGANYQSEVHRVIKFSVGGHIIPLMILYYVGPLKAYALLLPFSTISSSLMTLRSFTIFCGALTLVLTYYLVNRYLSKNTAIITTFLVAADPTFILSSRYDWGPIALQNILKIITLIFFFRVNTRQSVRFSLFLFGACSALMLWDKLNALWFLTPLGLFLIYIFRKNIWLLRYAVLGFIICAIPLLVIIYKRPFLYTESKKSFDQFEKYYYLNKSNSNLAALLEHYQSSPQVKLKNIVDTLNGKSIPQQILSETPQSSGVFVTILIVISTIFLIKNSLQIKLIIRQKNFSNPYLVISLLTCAISLFILLTPHANAPHHALMLYPLPHILLAGIMINLYRSNKILISLLIFILILSNITLLHEFNEKTKVNQMRVFWKHNNIEQVVPKLQQQNGKYVALDWGITLPIGYFSNGTIPIRDLQAFYEPKCQELQKLINQGYSPITYTTNHQVFPTYYTQCQAQLSPLITENIADYIIYKNPQSN